MATNPGTNPDVSFSIPAIAEPPVPVTPAFSIPDSYKEKDFVKAHLDKENPMESILSHYESLHTSALAPTTIPGDNATDEDWESFYSKTRPQDTSKYDLAEKLDFPESPEITTQVNNVRADQLPKVKELMHKNGLTAKQAKALAEGFDNMQKETIQKNIASSKAENDKMNAQFNDMMVSLGPDREAAIQSAKEFMYNKIPKEILPAVQALPNEALVAMIATIHHVTKSKLKEDNFTGTPSSVHAYSDPAEARSALHKAQADPAYHNKFDPRHEDVRAKVQKLAAIVFPVK